MMKKTLYAVLTALMLLSLTLFFVSCGDGSGGGGGGGDTPSNDQTDVGNQPSTGTAKIVFDNDNIGSCPIANGKFDLNAISSMLHKPGYIYEGIYDAPQGGALVVSTSGEFLLVLESDITLYPRWETMEYTLHFSTSTGRIEPTDETLILHTGERIPSLPSPLYDSTRYEFVGWEYNGTLISDKTTPKSEYRDFNFGLDNTSSPLELSASFIPAKLKIIFDHNDGSYEQKVYETEFGAPFNFPFPEVSGVNREVKYWSDDPSGANVFYAPETVTGSMTLYAIWAEYKDVEFFHMPEESTSQKYYKGEELSIPQPQREGYDFDGWYTSTSFSGNPIAAFSYGSLAPAYYAKWTPIEYELTLYDGEEVHKTLTYTVEDSLTFPTDLQKTGYTFIGWQDENGTLFEGKKEVGKVITGNLKAAYTPNKYTITYLFDGSVLRTDEVLYDSTLDLLVPEKAGYRFTGYLQNSQPFAAETFTFTENITLEATFEIIHYTVEYVLSGGENGEKNITEYTILDSFRFEDAFKEHYSFEGWYLDPTFETFYDEIKAGTTGNIKLYAYFRGLGYAAILKAEGGICQRDKVVVEYGASFSIPVCTKDGYSFDGWFTAPAGQEGVQLTDAEGKSLGVWDKGVLETPIYARYTKRHYIHIETDYPSAVNITLKDHYLTGELVTITADYDNGYAFMGFYDENGTVKTYSSKYQFRMPDGDVTLYLKFTPNMYKVTLNKGDAYCADSTVDAEYGQEFTLPVAFADGKQFVGWKYNGKLITDENGVATDFYIFKENITVTAEFAESENGAKMIHTYEDLLAMTENPKGTYVLVNDINVGGRKWTLVDFTGTLDGLNHTISGLTTPLFNTVNGTVKNLTLDVNVSLENIEAARKSFGALCYNIKGGTVDSIITTGSIVARGKYMVGGLAAALDNGTVINCKNYINIETNGENDYVGGILAILNKGTIKKCENRGNITGIHNVGGIVGWISDINFRECTNYGIVTGVDSVGGFAGRGDYRTDSTLESLYIYNKGAITGQTNVGGIFGFLKNETSHYRNNYTLKMTHLFNEGSVTGVTNVGGIMGQSHCNNTDSGAQYCYYSSLSNAGAVKGSSYVGGLFGFIYSDTMDSHISDSVSKNTSVIGEYMVGGLVGRAQNMRLISCSNIGMTVTATRPILDGGEYNTWLGGYVGYGTSVENCINNVTITQSAVGRYVGGIAGRLDGTAVNCANNADITAEKSSYVGGIAGFAYCSGNHKYEKLTNSGNIKGTSYTGGIFGKLEDYTSHYRNSYTLELAELKNSGHIAATGDYIGGIAGQIHCNNGDSGYTFLNATALDNTGNITGNAYIGGIVGHAYSDNAASYIGGSSSKNATVSAVYMVGGLAGRLENIALNDSFNDGMTIQATGALSEDSDYKVWLGGYVGYGASVTNCSNASTILYTENGWFVGGIAGLLSRNVNNCHNTGHITATKASHVGGIVGYLGCSGDYKNEELSNFGNISATTYVGGIFGKLENLTNHYRNNYTLELAKMKNSGNITATGEYAGGIAGQIRCNNSDSGYTALKATVLENTGNVIGNVYVGGLIGHAYSDTTDSYIGNSSSKNATVSATYMVGGLAGRLENVSLNDSSNEGMTIKATGSFLDGNEYHVWLGGYVGHGSSVANCTNNSNISYTENGFYIGGIGGRLVGSLNNCHNTGNISAPKANHVGGIVGFVYCNGNYKNENLTNSGNITGTSLVGGIFGLLQDITNNYRTDYTLELVELKNSGKIIATGDYAGGIAGQVYCNNTDSCTTILKATVWENTGNVTGNAYVGGLIGHAYSDNGSSYIGNSSSKKCSASATYMIGGLGGRLENVSLIDCSNEGMTIIATGYQLDGTTYNTWLGGYVGYGTSVTNCTNASALGYSENGRYIGGIAGRMDGAANNCHNTGNITAAKASYVGGVAGYLYCSGNYKNDNVSNTGNISGISYVGGIYGKLEDYINNYRSNYTLELVNHKNSGKITATGDYVGGIVGQIYCNNPESTSVILNATSFENKGNVTGVSYVGGICGYSSSDTSAGTFSILSNYGIITGKSNMGGLFGAIYNTPVSNGTNHAQKIVNNAVDGAENIGGVIGYTTSNLAFLENFAAVGNTTGTNVGGIAGQIAQSGNTTVATITNHAAIQGNKNVGGLIGYYHNDTNNYRTDYSATLSALTNNGTVTGSENVGGLIGQIYANNSESTSQFVHLNDSKNMANVTGKTSVGGAVGYSKADGGIYLTRIEAKNIAVTGEYYTGGIVGQGHTTDLDTCYNDGQILIANGYFSDGGVYYAYIGGYAGLCRSITNLTNRLEITYEGIGKYIGGIAGKMTGSIDSCHNYASITARNSENVGGIAGYAGTGDKVIKSSNNAAVVGKNKVGGIAGELYYRINNYRSNYTITVDVVSNSATISGSDYIGGLFGSFDIDNTDSASYSMVATTLNNTGLVVGNSYVGGWMGYFRSDGKSTIQISAATGSVLGSENSDQKVGKHSNLTIS